MNQLPGGMQICYNDDMYRIKWISESLSGFDTLVTDELHPDSRRSHEALNYVGYAYEEYKSNRQYRKRMLNSIINAFFIVLLRNHGANVSVPALTDSDKDQNLVYILKYMQEHFHPHGHNKWTQNILFYLLTPLKVYLTLIILTAPNLL